MISAEKARTHTLRMYALLVCATVFLILSRGMIDYSSPVYAGFDLHHYLRVAAAAPHLSADIDPPYAYRLLGPYIVGLLPLPAPLGFRLVTSITFLVLAILLFKFLTDQGIQDYVALSTCILFECGRYSFGLLVWDPFQIDDVLTMLCLLASIMLLFRRRWVAFALCFALGSLTREAVMILVPVSFVYLWENRTLRRDATKWSLAITPAILIFILVHVFVTADGTQMGLAGILPYYQSEFNDSIQNALTAEAWLRRLIWNFMPLTFLPVMFFRTTRSFCSRHKFMLLFFVLVVITDLWGIDVGGGDAERQMAPAFLPFFWLIAEILQTWFLRPKWALPGLLVGGYVASLHHLQGVYPLPSKLATLYVTLIGLTEITLIALWIKVGEKEMSPPQQSADMLG